MFNQQELERVFANFMIENKSELDSDLDSKKCIEKIWESLTTVRQYKLERVLEEESLSFNDYPLIYKFIETMRKAIVAMKICDHSCFKKGYNFCPMCGKDLS